MQLSLTTSSSKKCCKGMSPNLDVLRVYVSGPFDTFVWSGVSPLFEKRRLILNKRGLREKELIQCYEQHNDDDYWGCDCGSDSD